ncbi:hypothetical protein BH09VER1_BH09VER1_30820 [soil metagenome]
MKIDYLLATDFLVARWAEGPDGSADRWLQLHADSRLGIPWIVKGELLRAAREIGLAEPEVETFLNRYPTTQPDDETLRHYARLPATNLSVSEQWLAATALRHNIPLVTNFLPDAESTGVQIKRY